MKIEYRDGKVYLDDEYAMPGFSFTDEMFKARAAGRKTETRRLIKKKVGGLDCFGKPYFFHPDTYIFSNAREEIKPKFEAGQLVYVKEALARCVAFALYEYDDKPVICNGELEGWCWKRDRQPARFMPGIAARHFDRITEVKAERLQELWGDDIYAEGIKHYDSVWNYVDWFNGCKKFQKLWDKINPKHPWDSNPWVFVYKFEVVK